MKIKLSGICKQFGERVLDCVEAEMESGELLALVGNNGAGKTTLMKIMASLSMPTDGQVLIDGEPLCRSRIDLRARLHYLSDSPFFLSDSPIDHICLAAALYNRPLQPLKQQIVDWLRQFDVLEVAEKPLRNLSRGQKYKIAFIGLLAANPEFWILDEPFAAGVDPIGISAIKRSINKVVGAGGIVIYSTQIVEIAEQFSDRVWILHKGKLKIDTPTADVAKTNQAFGLAGVFEQLRVAK